MPEYTGLTNAKVTGDIVAGNVEATKVKATTVEAANLSVSGTFRATGATKVSAADASAAASDDGPTKAEFDAVVTLANELKTRLNAIVGSAS